MATIIERDDLPDALVARVDSNVLTMMLAGANATAARVAPCLGSSNPSPSADRMAEAKLILFSMLERWINDGSTGMTQQATVGPLQTTTTPSPNLPASYKPWPSEIASLQALCKGSTGGLSTIRTTRDGDCREHVVLAVAGDEPIILGGDPEWF